MKKIKKFDVMSVGKVLGGVYAGLGLILGGIFSLFAILGVVVGDGAGEKVMSLIFGIVAIIALPLMYGLMGFVTGVISAFVYNLVAKYTGGIQVEVES